MLNLNILLNSSLVTFCDAAEPWQLNTQDPATPMFEGMIFFHNYLLFFIIFMGFCNIHVFYSYST